MRSHLSCLVAAVLLVIGSTARAQVSEGSDAEQHLKADKIQVEMLGRQESALKAESVSLDAEQRSLLARRTALGDRKTTYANDAKPYNESVTRQQAAATAHNARCHGTSQDRAFVRDCNQKAADINAWGAKLDERKRALQASSTAIERDIDAYNADVAVHEKAVKLHRDAVAELKKKQANLAADMTSTLNKVLTMRGALEGCDKIPGIGDLDLTTLDGASERAGEPMSCQAVGWRPLKTGRMYADAAAATHRPPFFLRSSAILGTDVPRGVASAMVFYLYTAHGPRYRRISQRQRHPRDP